MGPVSLCLPNHLPEMDVSPGNKPAGKKRAPPALLILNSAEQIESSGVALAPPPPARSPSLKWANLICVSACVFEWTEKQARGRPQRTLVHVNLKTSLLFSSELSAVSLWHQLVQSGRARPRCRAQMPPLVFLTPIECRMFSVKAFAAAGPPPSV